jgi:transposase-like protein
MKFDRTMTIEALRRVVQRMHYPLEVMLVCVRWYSAYPLSFRQIEEMMAKRDHTAARAFFERAIDLHGVPEKITIDKSGANTAAIVSIQADSGLPSEMRQSKYLNNVIEQDHRAIKRITRPMLGFKTFRCARILIAGIEIMHMIHKDQLTGIKDQASSPANQFYSLAF